MVCLPQKPLRMACLFNKTPKMQKPKRHLSPSHGLADRILGWAPGNPGPAFPVACRLHWIAPSGNYEYAGILCFSRGYDLLMWPSYGKNLFSLSMLQISEAVALEPWRTSVLKPGSAGVWWPTVPHLLSAEHLLQLSMPRMVPAPAISGSSGHSAGKWTWQPLTVLTGTQGRHV